MHAARLMTVCVLVTASPMAAIAQPSFEVASVKQNTSASRNSRWDYNGETFTFTNGSLTSIISLAYGMISVSGIRRFQVIEGIPKWGEDRYDIVAKTAGQFPKPLASLLGNKTGPVNLMLQSLLVERFGLSAHWETRERAGFALVVAASDGRLGPNMKRSDVDCSAYRAEYRTALDAGKSLPLPTPGWRGSICGSQSYPKRGQEPAQELLMSTRPIWVLIEYLELHSGQPIVDRTGLTGNFDIELTYWPEGRIDTSGPVLAEAVRDQLGLRLIPQRLPDDVLVIDRVQRPTDN
jgi:uncharacterized protein (TIGR03435 family)